MIGETARLLRIPGRSGPTLMRYAVDVPVLRALDTAIGRLQHYLCEPTPVVFGVLKAIRDHHPRRQDPLRAMNVEWLRDFSGGNGGDDLKLQQEQQVSRVLRDSGDDAANWLTRVYELASQLSREWSTRSPLGEAFLKYQVKGEGRLLKMTPAASISGESARNLGLAGWLTSLNELRQSRRKGKFRLLDVLYIIGGLHGWDPAADDYVRRRNHSSWMLTAPRALKIVQIRYSDDTDDPEFPLSLLPSQSPEWKETPVTLGADPKGEDPTVSVVLSVSPQPEAVSTAIAFAPSKPLIPGFDTLDAWIRRESERLNLPLDRDHGHLFIQVEGGSGDGMVVRVSATKKRSEKVLTVRQGLGDQIIGVRRIYLNSEPLPPDALTKGMYLLDFEAVDSDGRFTMTGKVEENLVTCRRITCEWKTKLTRQIMKMPAARVASILGTMFHIKLASLEQCVKNWAQWNRVDLIGAPEKVAHFKSLLEYLEFPGDYIERSWRAVLYMRRMGRIKGQSRNRRRRSRRKSLAKALRQRLHESSNGEFTDPVVRIDIDNGRVQGVAVLRRITGWVECSSDPPADLVKRFVTGKQIAPYLLAGQERKP